MILLRLANVAGRLAGPAAALAIALLAPTVSAQPATECDRLAAEPGLVTGVPGVAFEAIEPKQATVACTQALQENPGERRILHSYARALQRSGDAEAAARLYGWAADEGYAASQFALAMLLQTGDGVPADLAAAQSWLTRAAEQGYEPAQAAIAAGALAGVTRPSAPAAFDAAATLLGLPSSGGNAAAPLAALKIDLEKLDTASAAAELFARGDALSPVDYNLDILAQSFDGEPLAAFAFVRDRIRFEAYQGALRGAEGALYSKAANAYDRALLLKALLDRLQVPNRFAFARLDDAAATRLYERMFERSTPAAVGGTPTGGAAPRAFAERLRARATRDYGLVQPALGARLDQFAPPPRAAVLEEIRPHVWVQANIADRWVDLDASLADAESGKPLANAESFAAELRATDYQSVTLRLIGETLSPSRLSESVVLERSSRAADLRTTQMFVLFQPLQGVSATGRAAGDASSAAAAALGADTPAADFETWTPGLLVDGVLETGKAIAVDEAALSAVWLEVDTAMPDGTHEVSRRALLDRIGPAGRVAGRTTLKPLERNDAGPLAFQTIHNIWTTTGRHNLLEFAGASVFLAELAGTTFADPERVAELDASEQLWPIALGDFLLPLLSDQWVVPALNDREDLRFYAAAPRVFIASHGPAAGANGGGIFTALDLHRDKVRGVTREAAGARSYAERQLWFGLLEGALETELNRDDAEPVLAGGGPTVSTSELAAGGVIMLTPSDAARAPTELANAALAGPVAARLAAGATVVVPNAVRSQGPAAWWDIAPDGTTRAVLELEALAGGLGGASYGGRPVIPDYRPRSPYSRGTIRGNSAASTRMPRGGMGPKSKPAGGGVLGEYATILSEVSVPNWFAFGVLGAFTSLVVVKCVVIVTE